MEGVALPQGGSGECRVPDAPAAARVEWVARALVTTVAPGSPGIPARNGFNGFLRALPGDRAYCHPRPRESLLLESLPPASIASLPYVRDDRETPLCVGRDGERSAGDLPQTAMEIFLQRGLDDPNQIEPKGEFFLNC